MKLTLAVDSHQIEVDFSLLDLLVNQIPGDDEQFTPVFAALAQSKSAGVRQTVASKPALSAETIALLASDPSPEVVEAICSAHTKDIPESILVGIIRRNWTNVNCAIANGIHDCDDADVTTLAKLLAASEDPAVRYSLAGNSRLPKAILKRFLADTDPYIRKEARNSLRY
jgi:hypothetical protein